MSDRKTYFIFLSVLASIMIFVSYAHTIFPVMDDDEFFVDKYGTIHGKYCPYKDVPWFTQKHSKYDILMKNDQDICNECLLHEKSKLYTLHAFNFKEKILQLKREGAPEEYISNTMEEYWIDY